MKKVKLIKTDTPEELEQVIEESDCFASQIFQDRTNNKWLAFLYFSKEEKSSLSPYRPRGGKGEDSKQTPSNPKSPFKLTEKQAEKWKDIEVTDGQRKALLGMKYSDVEIENLSKLEAYQIIKESKK